MNAASRALQGALVGSSAVRRWRAASLVVVAALFAGVNQQWAVACGVAGLVVVALALGKRVALGVTATRVVTLIAAGLGAAIGAVLPVVTTGPGADPSLRSPWTSFALAGLLAGAALLCRRDVGRGSGITLLPGLCALTACGEAPLGKVYGVVVIAFLGFALLALRAAAIKAGTGARSALETGAPDARSIRGSTPVRLAVVLGLAIAIAAGFAVALPPLALWSQGRILQALGVSEVGFSDRMSLGSLHGMLQSDEIVMRLDGARADYLRGAIFDHYELGRWGRRHRPVLTPFTPAVAVSSAPDGRTRVTVVGGARDRFFVPLGARAIETTPSATVDGYRVLRAREPATAVSFEPADSASTVPPDVAEPSEADLDVPAGLRGGLERIVAAWTRSAATPAEKVDAIRTRLQRDFTYSLEFDHHRRRDPLFDFLLDDHRGHCEYFASAMTLLARAAGVPARVAIGYRVAEQNPLGGTWIVRERNAHAWSEVFLEGRGFVTVDATPEGAVADNEPHREGLARAVLDIVVAGVGRGLGALGAHWAFGLKVGLGLGAAACSVVLVRRRVGRVRATTRARIVGDKPLPSLARLLDACAARGARRPPWEPLERFAERLEGAELARAAELLDRYAALRYGGVGSVEALDREMETCAAELGR